MAMAPVRKTPINVGNNERFISMAGGGLLALYSLRRAPGLTLMATLGGWLLYRGLSGNCSLYRALGINTAAYPEPAVANEDREQDIVDIAVEDSFPASDPPSWTMGR